jgi:calcineurin-like phosphoesterase family protein
MSRFVVSDHHFGHANIIEYCDRPFNSPGEMDTVMLNRHFEVVSTDDVVIHLGDVAMDMQDGRETVERMDALGGDLLVQGNHDVGLSDGQAPFPVVDSCVLSHDGYTFYCTHRPEHGPDNWDGWVLHGHHHNNDLQQYPLINSERKRVNVGVDLLNFRPISLTTITSILDACPPGSHLTDIDAVTDELDV